MLSPNRKLMVAGLLIAGLASTGFAQRAIAAPPFASQDGRFHIAFPGEPQVSTVTKKDPSGWQFDMHLLVVVNKNQDDKALFIVGYMDLSDAELQAAHRQGATDDELLAECGKGFLETLNVRVSAEKGISSSGVPGKEIDFDAPEGLTGVYRNYLVGNRIYQVVVGWQGAALTVGEANDFLDSFSIDR